MDGVSCEFDLFWVLEDVVGVVVEVVKKEFDVDIFSKFELWMFFSVMEGELEVRDFVIEVLWVCRKEVFIQEWYGRFNLNDLFLVFQRDYEVGVGDKEKKLVCINFFFIFEVVMVYCKKM